MDSLQFGDFVLESRLQRLLRDGDIIPLKPKAYDLLCKLLTDRDRVISKNELLDYLWPRQDVSEANLSQTVYELRQALGETARNASWIETVPRRGYRFRGQVSTWAGGKSDGPVNSIAVLPMRALTSQPDMRDLGFGITDAVILSVGGAGRLVVRSLSAVLPYADSDTEARVIGQRLDVDAVLEGTLQRFGDRVRLNARLFRCFDGDDLWTDTIETKGSDLFAVQDQIARQTSDAVVECLCGSAPGARPRSRASDSKAHPLYLKARYCWQRWVPEATQQALQYLDEALDLDPDHAPSHAWRSAAWSMLGILGEAPPSEVAKEARQAAQRAIEIDATYSEGYEMLGAVQLFFDWDLVAAALCFDKAIDLNPESVNARHLRALSLSVGGHYEAALAEIERAVSADPSSLIANCDVGMVHYWGRQFDDAIRSFEATLEQEPAFAHARAALAFALVELGETERAVREIRRASEGRGQIAAGELAYVLGRAGQLKEAERVIAYASASSDDQLFDPYVGVLAQLGMSESDKTFDWLDKALAHRSRDLVFLGVNPVFDPIREDARFTAFRERAGLPEVVAPA